MRSLLAPMLSRFRRVLVVELRDVRHPERERRRRLAEIVAREERVADYLAHTL